MQRGGRRRLLVQGLKGQTGAEILWAAVGRRHTVITGHEALVQCAAQ
jgi:hypothetical protein